MAKTKMAYKANATGVFADEEDNDKTVRRLVDLGYSKKRIVTATGLSLTELGKILKRLGIAAVIG